MSTYIQDITAEKLSSMLKAEGKSAPAKTFTKMDKKVYEELKKIIKEITAQSQKKRKNKEARWLKLLRLDSGEKSKDMEYWDTIFTDEW